MTPVPLHARNLSSESGPSAPHLVILHGLLGSSDNWQTLGKRYAATHHVWMLDARNHGRSPHNPIHSYPAMAEDVLAFLDARGLDKVSLLGHSMGGKTTLHMAENHPDRLDKIVVADIASRAYTPHHGPIFDALIATQPSQAQSRQEVEEILRNHIGAEGNVIVPFLMKGLHRAKMGGFAWRFNVPVLQAALSDIVGAIEVGMNTLPALFIRGGKSNYVIDKDLEQFEAQFLQMDHHTIRDAGHWLHAEAPDEFFQVTADFLA